MEKKKSHLLSFLDVILLWLLVEESAVIVGLTLESKSKRNSTLRKSKSIYRGKALLGPQHKCKVEGLERMSLAVNFVFSSVSFCAP